MPLALLEIARTVLAGEPGVAVDYVEIVDAETFEPVVSLRRTCYVLIAPSSVVRDRWARD